ncbi:hypothetical protein CNMCM5793_009479 [Aspergillus hiratsukae]|uniref:Uncharacterized protein n=1 Tax=Aspergillus hiratsukae TaxID=1194566 RepID=A0A8H6UFJ2_9EURO|nr:hypothetical protein CNMCM5793_009479 [Aspergillus hiratsukae]KAF7160632.1 hypothetical protein CNMCM6106_008054 [Aspergillus hiratsukae]
MELSHTFQFSLEEHLQENEPVTPSKSPNKTRLTESEGFDEYATRSDRSHVLEFDDVRNGRKTNAKATTSTVPVMHFVFDEPLPTNPNNSPASEGEQANQLSSAYPYRERSSALSSHKPNIISITCPDCSLENGSCSFLTDEGGSNWRPPRPPKPPFLTAVEGFKLSGQAQPRARIISPESKHPQPSPRASLPQPRRWPRSYSRFVENTPSEEKNASAVQRKETWINTTLLKPHHQEKIAHRGAENAYRVLLGDPDKPFPAPIPTNDRLPLLRAVLSRESRIAFLRSLTTDYGASSSRPKETTVLKHLAGLLSRPSRLIPRWHKLRSSTPITLTLYQPLHSPRCSSLVQGSYMVHVEAGLSTDRNRAADSQQDGPSSNTSMDGYARVFQLRFPVPTLCFDIVRPFVIGMRHPILVTVASMFVCVLAIILRFLAGIGFWGLFSGHEDHPYLEEEDSDSAALRK